SKVQTRPVNASQQQRALQVLAQTLTAQTLQIPEHIQALLVPRAYGEGYNREQFNGLTGLTVDTDTMAASAARFVLDLILHPHRLERLQQQHSRERAIPDVTAVRNTIAQATISPAQRADATSLEQRLAFESLGAITHAYQQENTSATVKAALYSFLQRQQQQWQQAAPSAHRDYAMHALKTWEEGKPWPLKPAPALPPGSPI